MKTLYTIVLVCFAGLLNVVGQNDFKLSVVKGTDKPNTESEHQYLINLENNSRSSTSFVFTTENVNCKEENIEYVNLIQEVYTSNLNERVSSVTLSAGESYNFYVKIKRPLNTKLGSWNCTKITASSSNGTPVKKSVMITTWIQDPKDAN